MLRHQYTWLPRVDDVREPIIANATLEWGGPNIRIFAPLIKLLVPYTQVRLVATSADPTVVMRIQSGDHVILADNLNVPVNTTVNAPIATNSIIVSGLSPLDASSVAYTVTLVQSKAQQVDDWGNPLQTTDSPPAIPPVAGKPCLFRDQAKMTLTLDGPIQTETNSIAIPWDDTLAIGDWIADISDPSTGHHFIEQPIRVDILSDVAPHGDLIYRVAHLRYAEVQ